MTFGSDIKLWVAVVLYKINMYNISGERSYAVIQTKGYELHDTCSVSFVT